MSKYILCRPLWKPEYLLKVYGRIFMSQSEMILEKSDAVHDRLEKRYILDEDLKQVIAHAESTGEKLYQPDEERFLSKLRVGEACFYVEYSPVKYGYRIHTAYTHRSVITGE
jgi:hypothetical protein